MELSSKRKETSITLDGNDYILRELDGNGRDEVMQSSTKGLRIGEDGKPELGSADLRGQSALLISLSIFKKDGTQAFTKEEVQSWSSSSIEELYRQASKMSGLDHRAKSSAKND